MVMERFSQQLHFNYYCGLSITSIYCACRDVNVRLKSCAVIKFRVKLKTAQLANFPLLSRHTIVCRNILKPWEDMLSPGCDLKHFMNVKLSRPHHSFEGITLVATSTSCCDLNDSSFSID